MKRLLVIVFLMFASVMFVAAEKTTVTVVLENEANTVKWIKGIKKAYEQRYPDKHVELNMFSGTEADFFTKLSLLLRSSDQVDVIYEDSSMIKSDVNAGLLAPLPVDQWSDWESFYPSLREFATIKGNTYGIPLSTDTRGLWYNANYFKKAGIQVPWEPKNWNDILEAARKVKEKIPDVIPISFNVAAKGESTSMQTFLMLLSGTNDTLYKNGKWVLKSQGFLDSLKFIDTVYKKKLGAPLDVVLNAQYGNKLVYNLIPEQKVAMAIEGCWIASAWKVKYPETLEKYEFTAMPTQFGQAPGKTSVSGGWMLSVSAKSKNKAEAFKFIQFALNKENDLKYIQTVGNLATRTDVANMSEYPSYMKDAAEFINFTHFRPANEQYPMISPFMQKAVESVATGQSTPEEAVQQYADSVKNTVGEKFVTE